MIMNEKENKEPQKEYVYFIHWQRETGVTDWDVMKMIAQYELCGQSPHEVMRQVKREMIATKALRNDCGIYPKVFRRLEDAQRIGVSECLQSYTKKARQSICKILGVDMIGYLKLLKLKEIIEHQENTYMDPIKKQVRKDYRCLISWGPNSLYDSRMAHEDLHFCKEIMTEVICWIEKRDMY